MVASAFAQSNSCLAESTAWPNTQPTNPDVMIIGAGISGLEAAKILHSKGIRFVVVEADNRIGGRVYTNNKIFEVPLDTHPHWMSYPKSNPLIKSGKDNGFDVYRDLLVELSNFAGGESI